MAYKVTAIKDVTIRANVPTADGHKPTWIKLSAGQSKSGLGMVWGIHPDCVPSEIPAFSRGAQTQIVFIPTPRGDEDLPKDFFGVVRLEVAG